MKHLMFNPRFFPKQLLGLLVFILFVSGCKKADDDLGTFGVCPEVMSTNPANLATGVMLNSPVVATFNEAMTASAFTSASFVVKQGANVVAGTITYSDSSVVFTPAADFAPLTEYSAMIKAGVKDPAGNAMIDDYSWTFTTGELIDIIAPTVTSTDPINEAIDVAIAKVISVNFSEVMDPATLLSNYKVVNTTTGGTTVDGVVSYSGTTAVFTPTLPLENNNLYTVTITTGAKDLPGNALAADYNFSFTTIAIPDLPPTIILTSPINLALLVERNAIVTATFNENINTASVTSTSFVVKDNGVTVPGSVTASGSTATFTPAGNLSYSTVYTATVTTGVEDPAGNKLVSDYSWSFTIRPEPIVPPVIGTLRKFGVFGGTAGITNQGTLTTINNGAIATTGVSTLVTGFHDGLTAAIYTQTPLNIGLVTDGIFTAPPAPGDGASFAIATEALAVATALYDDISPASKPGGMDPGAGELGGLTLNPGIYKSAGGSFNITNGDLTLDGKGDPNAVFIFQAPSSLTVGIAGPTGAKSVILINGAQAKNVFWWVGSAATINGAGGGVMSGTIISSAGVTFSTAGNMQLTVLNGQAISLVGAVTMVNTTINVQ